MSTHPRTLLQATLRYADRQPIVPVDAAKNHELAEFAVRIIVTASDRRGAFGLANEFIERARGVAPDGVVVRYAQLQPGHALGPSQPSMEPERGP